MRIRKVNCQPASVQSSAASLQPGFKPSHAMRDGKRTRGASTSVAAGRLALFSAPRGLKPCASAIHFPPMPMTLQKPRLAQKAFNHLARRGAAKPVAAQDCGNKGIQGRSIDRIAFGGNAFPALACRLSPIQCQNAALAFLWRISPSSANACSCWSRAA